LDLKTIIRSLSLITQISLNPQLLDEEGQKVQMDDGMPEHVQHSKGTIYRGTSFIDAWSIKAIPNQVWHIKSGNQSGTY
jgi:hypothetical protein